MEGYNDKSCNAVEKSFYRPVEVALRWCGLMAHEVEILAQLNGGRDTPAIGQFSDWPCLQANTEKILDAILNGDIPYGRDGKTVDPGTQVRADRLTVRHTDLRVWMTEHYQEQKPDFLFDEIERKTHAAFNKDTFLTLQADLAAGQSERKKLKAHMAVVTNERDALRSERDSLLKRVDAQINPNERNSLLIMIAALCQHSGIDPSERGVAPRIMVMTDEIGVHLDDETIRSALKKIPDALESRMR